MYKVEIHLVKDKYISDLQEAFKDRDIKIEINQAVEKGLSYVIISNVHPITMTPLMWWILHHIDKSDYYEIIIS